VTRGTVELPESARDKLLALQLASDAALDSARSSNARLQSLPQDAADAMRTRLAAERDRHNTRHNQLSRLLSASRQWIAQQRPGIVLEVAPAVSVALKNGETLSAAIGSVREEIAATKRDLQSVRSAPMPASELKRLAEERVVSLMRQGKVGVAIVRDELKLSFKGDMAAPEDVLALLSWFAPEQLLRRLEYEIDQLPARDDALSADARIKRAAELEAQLLELERREEALVMRAADDGLDVLRRPDANPCCVLGVVVTARAQVA
jgi:hypothetical protein